MCQSCMFFCFCFFCSKNLSGKSDYWQFIWSGFRADCLQTGGSLVLGANHFKLSAASLGRAAEDVPSSLRFFFFFFWLSVPFFASTVSGESCWRLSETLIRPFVEEIKIKETVQCVFSSSANVASHLTWSPICVAWILPHSSPDGKRLPLLPRLERAAENVCCPTNSCVIAPEGCAFFNTCSLYDSFIQRVAETSFVNIIPIM